MALVAIWEALTEFLSKNVSHSFPCNCVSRNRADCALTSSLKQHEREQPLRDKSPTPSNPRYEATYPTLDVALQNVWDLLENDQWRSKQALSEASSVDIDTLDRLINFLDRWGFVEIRKTPELLVRRGSVAVSVVETFNLLRAINCALPESKSRGLVERVACRVCGGRNLSSVGVNLVECMECHEEQWFAVEVGESHRNPASMELPRRLGLLRWVFVRLGLPQEAFCRYVPKRVRYFWFRCTSCGKVSDDYPHGHSRYLTCPSCESHNHF